MLEERPQAMAAAAVEDEHRLTPFELASLLLPLMPPLATTVPALAALVLVTGVWLALQAYELVWWREARAELRSLPASPHATDST